MCSPFIELFAAVPFLSLLVGELYPVLLAAFSPVFPESEILRVKVWVYTAPLWLYLPQTTALVLEELPGTLTSLLPYLNSWMQFLPHFATPVGMGTPWGKGGASYSHASAMTPFRSVKRNFRAGQGFSAP